MRQAGGRGERGPWGVRMGTSPREGRIEGQRKTKRGMERLGREKGRVREEREDGCAEIQMYDHFHIHSAKSQI